MLPVLLSFETGASPTGISTGVLETREVLSRGTLDVEVTGVLPVQADTNDLIQENLELVTLATALAIFLIVALTYRSLVAPLVPLVSIGLSAFLTLRVLGWLAVEQGIAVPSQVEPIIVVLLLVSVRITRCSCSPAPVRRLERGPGAGRRPGSGSTKSAGS